MLDRNTIQSISLAIEENLIAMGYIPDNLDVHEAFRVRQMIFEEIDIGSKLSDPLRSAIDSWASTLTPEEVSVIEGRIDQSYRQLEKVLTENNVKEKQDGKEKE